MGKQSRKISRKQLSVIEGGGQPKPPENTPAARLAVALDRSIRQHCEQDPELKLPAVAATLLQLAAGICVELGASIDDVQGAAGTFYDQEYEVRKGKPRV